MRYATIRHDGRTAGAVVRGDRVFVTDAPTALAASSDTWAVTPAAGRHLDDVALAPVSPDPPHVVCVGLNYGAHLAELGRGRPSVPALFAKYTSTLTGARDPIVLPAVSDHVDGEVELTLVIGRTVHREPPASARDAIAGFTVANDLSMRDWQHRTTEALQGKVFDRSTPVGPVMVTPDEFDAVDAGLTLLVDGEMWRAGSTAEMLFEPAELVSYCSMFTTLQPGDLLLTGTPGRTPGAPVSLRPGSVITARIDGLGETANRTVRDTLADNSASWTT